MYWYYYYIFVQMFLCCFWLYPKHVKNTIYFSGKVHYAYHTVYQGAAGVASFTGIRERLKDT